MTGCRCLNEEERSETKNVDTATRESRICHWALPPKMREDFNFQAESANIHKLQNQDRKKRLERVSDQIKLSLLHLLYTYLSFHHDSPLYPMISSHSLKAQHGIMQFVGLSSPADSLSHTPISNPDKTPIL